MPDGAACPPATWFAEMVGPVESETARPIPPKPSSQFWSTVAPWVVATSIPLPPTLYMTLPLTFRPRPGSQAPVQDAGCQSAATSGRLHQFDVSVTALPVMS
jgi:hypothetical protein